MGKLLKFLDETENHLLNFVRRSILVVSVLAIILSGIIMIIAAINFFDGPDISPEDNIWPKIKWNDPVENIIEKQKRLKNEATNKTEKKSDTNITTDTPAPVKEIKDDPDVLIVANNYKRAFPDPKKFEKIKGEFIEIVKDYKKTIRKYYGKDRSDEFMEQLVEYSNDLGEYYYSFKFELTDEQASIVTSEVEQTLSTFVSRFDKAVSDRNSEASMSESEARRNNQKAMGQIMWSLYLLGSVVVIIFVILEVTVSRIKTLGSRDLGSCTLRRPESHPGIPNPVILDSPPKSNPGFCFRNMLTQVPPWGPSLGTLTPPLGASPAQSNECANLGPRGAVKTLLAGVVRDQAPDGGHCLALALRRSRPSSREHPSMARRRRPW